MHLLLVGLLWVLSFAVAYSVGRAWVESRHAGGLARVSARGLAALAALGFTAAYFLVLVAALELSGGDPAATAGIWDRWYVAFAPAVAGEPLPEAA